MSSTRSKMARVRLPAMNPAQKLNFFLFTSAEGKGAPLPFLGPSQSFGFSLFPLPMSGDLRSLSTTTWSPLRDPHSFLTVTCLTAWYCQFKYGRIVLVLPLRLRGLSRDKCHYQDTPLWGSYPSVGCSFVFQTLSKGQFTYLKSVLY